jgi:hypothetical protein
VKKIGRDIKRMFSAFASANAAEHLSMSDKLKHLKMNSYKEDLHADPKKSLKAPSLKTDKLK